jgi:hypothetical protein
MEKIGTLMKLPRKVEGDPASSDGPKSEKGSWVDDNSEAPQLR